MKLADTGVYKKRYSLHYHGTTKKDKNNAVVYQISLPNGHRHHHERVDDHAYNARFRTFQVRQGDELWFSRLDALEDLVRDFGEVATWEVGLHYATLVLVEILHVVHRDEAVAVEIKAVKPKLDALRVALIRFDSMEDDEVLKPHHLASVVPAGPGGIQENQENPGKSGKSGN